MPKKSRKRRAGAYTFTRRSNGRSPTRIRLDLINAFDNTQLQTGLLSINTTLLKVLKDTGIEIHYDSIHINRGTRGSPKHIKQHELTKTLKQLHFTNNTQLYYTPSLRIQCEKVINQYRIIRCKRQRIGFCMRAHFSFSDLTNIFAYFGWSDFRDAPTAINKLLDIGYEDKKVKFILFDTQRINLNHICKFTKDLNLSKSFALRESPSRTLHSDYKEIKNKNILFNRFYNKELEKSRETRPNLKAIVDRTVVPDWCITFKHKAIQMKYINAILQLYPFELSRDALLTTYENNSPTGPDEQVRRIELLHSAR